LSILKPFRYEPDRQRIEDKANEVLKSMQASPKHVPKFPLDPSFVAEFLGLDISWEGISPDEDGQIAARILPLKKLIQINDDIPELRGGFGNFTIAHEVGHWMLHVNRDEANGISKQQELNLGFAEIQPFLCRSINDNQVREWQANYFAGCLLMPRHILEDLSRGRSLTNWNHLYAMIDELGVTISALKTRLQQIGWITIPNGSKQIYLGKSAPTKQGNLFQ
jgi:Zn-dependent peptidase ImmA (M78 family)